MAKLPAPDRTKIRSGPAAIREVTDVLWRLHAPTHPQHPMRWNQLRAFGPLPQARFDPWLPPATGRAGEGVGYFGLDVPTCIAEAFQVTRTVNPARGGLQLTAFAPTRPLSTLDLRGDWPIQIGASHLINSGPKNRCREWAHALHREFPDADGLTFTGMAGRDCLVLYEPPSADAFPAAPGFSRPLSDPLLASRVADACAQIGYTYVG